MSSRLSYLALFMAAAAAFVMPGNADSDTVSEPGVWESLPQSYLTADVVILGEVHDNPAHHANQARAVSARDPAALVFEMITPAQAARITAALRHDPDALAEALEWEASGWPAFADYYPIFQSAPEAEVFGGGTPVEAVRRAMDADAATVFGDQAARYGLDRSLSEAEQAAREEMQGQAHCDALPGSMLPGMVEAQRLRDAELARSVVTAHKATGGPVVLITGTGHARTDWGVPVYLRAAAPGLSVFSVGQREAGTNGASDEDDPPFDLLLITEPAPRDDPCAAFR